VLALLRVVVGAGLALVAFEPIARLYYDFPGVDEAGIGPVPATGSQVRWCVEGCASSTWQAHGVRRLGPYQLVHPDVIVLGDSNTEALQVGDDEVYTARLERSLGEAMADAYRDQTDASFASESQAAIADEIGRRMERRRVREVMIQDVVTVSPELPVTKAAQLLIERRIHRLPVVENGKLVGIVSSLDFTRLVAEAAE